jgi:outer membrane protein OmpA-like peptidoglycan-associated protein
MLLRIFSTGALILGSFVTSILFAQDDQPNSKDHPLFTRMPGYFIENYTEKDFDKFEFETRDGKLISVEGRYTEIGYRPKDNITAVSPIQIGRNYLNAIAKIGGVTLYDDIASGGGVTTMKLTKGKQEIWVKLRIGDSGNNYHLSIIEKALMEQLVTANADVWKSDITTSGHAAVYGILFDTDKSIIKPESEAALKEIAALLKNNASLNIRLVGHSDGTGDFNHNVTLSEARAKAVMSALTTQYAIAPSRLSAHGVGPLAPVASNDTEDGRTKNRRVELVKR